MIKISGCSFSVITYVKPILLLPFWCSEVNWYSEEPAQSDYVTGTKSLWTLNKQFWFGVLLIGTF